MEHIVNGRMIVALLIVAAGLSAAIIGTSHTPQRRGPTSLPEGVLADPDVFEVASNFWCPCGRCGQMELLECQCRMPNGAVEVYTAIREELQQRRSISSIVSTIASRFGGLKRDGMVGTPPASGSPSGDASPADRVPTGSTPGTT
jgi:hypothetical protein